MDFTGRYWLRRVILMVLIGMIGFAVYQVIQQNKNPLKVGDVVPDIAFTTMDGKSITLKSLRGKVVMLNFWGSWCSPCREEMPTMQKMYEKVKGQHFEIVAINLGETEVAVTAFVKQNKLTFPIWMDKNKVAGKIFNIDSIPVSFFINKEGKIVDYKKGMFTEAELQFYINKWKGA
jgi:thiol-disulfide isomerase/thioredoxin